MKIKQKGFLTIIALLIVVFLIAIMVVIVLKSNIFLGRKNQPSDLLKVPEKVEEELKEIQEEYKTQINTDFSR